MMPSRFLGIIPAVSQAIEGRTQQLATAKEPVDGPRRGPAEAPRQREHTPEAEAEPQQRRHDDEEQRLGNPTPHERTQACLRKTGADQTTDQRMRRTGGEARVPGHEVPENRPQ